MTNIKKKTINTHLSFLFFFDFFFFDFLDSGDALKICF